MKQTSRILFGLLRFGIGIGLVVYLGVSGAINWPVLLGLGAAWRVTLLALPLLFVAMVVSAWRLCVLMRALDLGLSLYSSARLTLIGIFFNACLPGGLGGDVVRIYYATEGNRGRRTEVATVILFDRAVGMFALIVLPLMIAPFTPELLASIGVLRALLWTAAAVAALMLVGMLALSSSPVRNSTPLDTVFRKVPFGGHAKRILEIIRRYRYQPRVLLASVGISLLSQVISVFAILLLAGALNPEGYNWRMSIMVPLGLVANVLPVTPGGLGVGEAAFDRLFSMAGSIGGAEVMLGWRLLMISMGFVGLVFYLQGRRRHVHQTASLEGVREESLLPQPQH